MKNNNSIKLTKTDLIFNYSRQEFPTHLFGEDIVKYSDFIFSDESQDPDNKKHKFSNSFIIEDEIEPRKGGYKGKKPYQNTHKNFNNPPPSDSWRRNEPEDPGFFDDFKGKSDAKQVIAFKRNLELTEIKEVNIMIDKENLTDFKLIEENNFFETKKKKNGKKNFYFSI